MCTLACVRVYVYLGVRACVSAFVCMHECVYAHSLCEYEYTNTRTASTHMIVYVWLCDGIFIACKLICDLPKCVCQRVDTIRLFIQHVYLRSCVHNCNCACVDKWLFVGNLDGSFYDNICRPLIVSAKGDRMLRDDNQPQTSRTRTFNVRHAFLYDVRCLAGFEGDYL